MSNTMEFIIKAQDKTTEVMNRLEQKASTIGGKMNQSFNKAAAGSESFNRSMEKTGTVFDKISHKSTTASTQMASAWNNASQSINNSMKTTEQSISHSFKSAGQIIMSTAKTTVQSVKSSFQSITREEWSGLANKFKSAMQSMAGSAKDAANSIANSFKGAEAGITDVIALAGAGLGINELFNTGFQYATTQQRLQNIDPAGAAQRTAARKEFASKSSTKDFDIDTVFAQTHQLNPGNVYRALNAVDAASKTGNEIKDIGSRRAFSMYLTGGWDSVAGMMRDEGLTPEEKEMLKNAKTEEEKLAAIEAVAKRKGGLDPETGESISTVTDGPMGAYNRIMALWDQIVLGAVEGLDWILDKSHPILDFFEGLGDGFGDVVGKGLLALGLITGLGAGLKILKTVLSPFSGILKGVGKAFGWLGDKLGITDKVKEAANKIKDKFIEGVSKIKDKLAEPLGKLKDAIVDKFKSIKDAVSSKLNDLKNWIQNNWNPKPGGPTSKPGGSTPTPIWGAVGTLGAVGALTLAGVGTGYVSNKAEEAGYSNRGGGPILQGGGLTSLIGPFFKGTAQNIEQAITTGDLDLKSIFTNYLGQLLPSKQELAAGLVGLDLAKLTLDWIKSKINIPEFSWPGVNDVLTKIKEKFPKISSFKWPKVSDVLSMIRKLFPSISGFKWPSAGQVLDYIKGLLSNKIPSLQWPSVGAIAGWIQNAITGHSGVGIGVGLRGPGGGSNGARGPSGLISRSRGTPNIHNILDKTFTNMTYDGYAGNQQGPFGTLMSGGGNCVDMSLDALRLAGLFGETGELQLGSWDGGLHVYPRIGGRDYDPARKALTGSSVPPARGPGNANCNDVNLVISVKEAPARYDIRELARLVIRGIRDPKTQKELDIANYNIERRTMRPRGI